LHLCIFASLHFCIFAFLHLFVSLAYQCRGYDLVPIDNRGRGRRAPRPTSPEFSYTLPPFIRFAYSSIHLLPFPSSTFFSFLLTPLSYFAIRAPTAPYLPRRAPLSPPTPSHLTPHPTSERPEPPPTPSHPILQVGQSTALLLRSIQWLPIAAPNSLSEPRFPLSGIGATKRAPASQRGV
jgi:hypothetical protein